MFLKIASPWLFWITDRFSLAIACSCESAHDERLSDLPAPLVGPLFQNAQLLERAIEEGLGADGTFVAINNHISQSVPHVHIHPRRLATARMASKASSGPGNATRMMLLTDLVQETLRTTIARLRSHLSFCWGRPFRAGGPVWLPFLLVPVQQGSTASMGQ